MIEDLKDKFLKGAKSKNIDPAIAEDVYDKMGKFGEYGFNKSHSAAYGLVTWQTAYLKTHFTTEYMCALLTSASGKQDDVIKYIADCRAHGIAVLPPSVNKSDYNFTIEGPKTIRFGFRALKGLGDKAIESIIGARDSHGEFSTITSFLENVEIGVVNKGVLEALIKSGALESIHKNRAELLSSIDSMIEAAKSLQKDKRSGQASLFGEAQGVSYDIELAKMEDLPENMKLGFEKEVLGLYVSGHPLQKFEKEIRLYSSCGSITELEGKGKNQGGDYVCSLAGILTSQVRKISQKKGTPFAVAVLEDLSTSIEVLFFRKVLEKSESLIFSDEPVLVTGKIAFDDTGEPQKMIADSLKPLREARREAVSAIHIKIDPIGFDDDTLEALKKICNEHKGNCEVFFHIETGTKEKERKIIKAHNSIRVKASNELIEEIQKLIGKDTIRYTLRGI